MKISSNKILIVEDDKFLRELLSKKLSEEHYKVVVAVDGSDALKKISEDEPGLILLDLILPGMSGFDVLEELKRNNKRIPVIVLSNLGQKEEIEKGLKLGAVDYLIKAHFTPDEIITKIKKYLE